ncbi:hypothetical protein E1B28_006224 [Marasmius oreades]|uniref:Uncharacterized protein n=1 Tax=Marasmius oreades TaxID=181124 RepID=A0A9P7S5E4_9AGAR|nr:uncharacterized protein E1B28_006224 [Marasmius oreades]KAG7095485.1 hypothetical protein E1B28_006224 [Marasmius oreades]
MSQPPSGNQSRSSSSGPPPAQQQQRSQSRNRGRSRTPRSASASSGADSDAGPAKAPRNRRRGGQRQGGGLPGLDEVDDTGKQVTNTAKGAVDSVGDAVGGVAGGGKKDDDEGGGDKPLKLRLDLNLDVAVELKAKVHGDLTLSLL